MNFILSAVMTLMFSLAAFQSDKAATGNAFITQENAPANQAVQTQPPDDGAARITLADAKADYDAGRAIIIDARDADSYKAEHIKGAINIPGADFDKFYKDKKIPIGKKLIVYCS